MSTKTCTKCVRDLPVEAFFKCRKNPDGLQYNCRECGRKAQDERARRLGVPQRVQRVETEPGKKQCLHCLNVFPLDQFSPAKRGTQGVAAYCKKCQSQRAMRDKEAHAAKARRWRRENEAWRKWHSAFMSKRRAMIVAASDGTVTPAVIRALYAAECCHYCTNPVLKTKRTMDHKTPISRGGHHSAVNLVMACLSCNSSKQDRTEAEFVAHLTGATDGTSGKT